MLLFRAWRPVFSAQTLTRLTGYELLQLAVPVS